MINKKIDKFRLGAMLISAIFVFSIPYIVDIVSHSTKHCLVNYQSMKCAPVIF